MKKVIFAALASMLLIACKPPATEKNTAPATTSSTQNLQKMFVHHVYFYMKPDASEADRVALRAGIESLTKIEAIKNWHIGTPAPTDRPVIERGYTFSWLALFENGPDQEVYQNHPVHLEFVKNCSHLWTKVVVYDSI